MYAAYATGVSVSIYEDHRPACVYRWFDSEGLLLYVGRALNPVVRAHQHESKHWHRKAVRCEIEWCDTVGEADAVERLAIIRESPKYNKLWKPHGAHARWLEYVKKEEAHYEAQAEIDRGLRDLEEEKVMLILRRMRMRMARMRGG